MENEKIETLKILYSRGIELKELVDIVEFAQKKYHPNLTKDIIEKTIKSVCKKREVLNAVKTGVALDILTEQNFELPFGLTKILKDDEPLYGIDEILALSITNLYGTIALSNFGYLDKIKVGVLEQLNNKNQKQCNTFLDDLVAAICAATCSKIAHTQEK